MIKKVLKYISRIFTYTLLTILIIFGLSLLFVFVTSKVAKTKGQEPPINLFTIISPSMTPSINVYDVVVSIKTEPSKIKAGDVISFYSSNPNVHGMTVTHRVTQITQNGSEFSFRTKGDANKAMDSEVIYQDKIVGKVYFKIPQLGKIQFFLGSKGGWLIAILIPALAIISYDIYKIIKLIIVKQKILSYKNGNVETKAELENNSIVTDVMDEMPKQDEKQETPIFEEVLEKPQTQEVKLENNVDNEVMGIPQVLEEVEPIPGVAQISIPEEQSFDLIKPEQVDEPSLLEVDEFKLEEFKEEVKTEETINTEKPKEEVPEEIIVISD